MADVLQDGKVVDQDRLGRAAHAGAPHLGVEAHGLRHPGVGGLVHIDMADAFEVAEHRNARILLNTRHKALATTRHDQVQRAAQRGRAERHHHAASRVLSLVTH